MTGTKEEEREEFARQIASFLKKEGGETTMTPEGEYLKTSDYKISELERALKEAGANADRYRDELEKVVGGHPKPREAFAHFLECPDCKPEFEALVKPLTDEAYDKGKADSKANLTEDDLNAHLVGTWLRKQRAIGVGKDDKGEDRVIKSIQFPSGKGGR